MEPGKLPIWRRPLQREDRAAKWRAGACEDRVPRRAEAREHRGTAGGFRV